MTDVLRVSDGQEDGVFDGRGFQVSAWSVG